VKRLAVVAVAALAAGCGSSSSNSSSHASINLSSPAFASGGVIPRKYTCDGADVSPPLRWSGVPTGTKKLRLLMRDPDAPGGNYIPWSVGGIAPTAAGLVSGRLPKGAIAGDNSFGSIGYRGPCPPRGDKPHHYEITVSALSGSTVLASGTLTGTYARR
jgi:Raf kinase inhibitor-like YbhB/YbcL family protein